MFKLPRQLFISFCVVTRQTERAAHRHGAGYFLPEFCTLRFANMGGLDREEFSHQLGQVNSFAEDAWCGYWNELAGELEARAQEVDGEVGSASAGLLRKAITYYTISALPGGSPARMEAYWNARRLFERLMALLDEGWERVRIEVDTEGVEGYLRLPTGSGEHPLVIVSHGLEGTAPELVFPLSRYRDSGLGVFVMEMPGTYAYKTPMSGASAQIYDGVIENLAADPRVDPKRIAFVGISFGGYWAARIAATNQRLACAVASGPPGRHSFGPRGSLGIPQVIVDASMQVTGTRSLFGLNRALADLASSATHDRYRQITIPLLVINGDSDSLVSPKDSVDLACKAPKGILKLYEGDDHCAMGHYDEWLNLVFDWLRVQLAGPKGALVAAAGPPP